MICYPCPQCAKVLEVPVSQGGQQLHCPSCGSITTVPQTALVPASLPAAATDSVAIPVLVSAIANAVFAFLLLLTCFGFILAVPLGVLCAFEFLFYSQLRRLPAEEVARRATVLGIFEIFAGLINLGISLVCGIIVLVNASRLRQVALTDAPDPLVRDSLALDSGSAAGRSPKSLKE